MSRGKAYIVLLLFLFLFTGCGGAGTTNLQTTQQTEYITAVPAEYFRTSAQRGQVIRETYRSKDYTTSSDSDLVTMLDTYGGRYYPAETTS